MTETVWRKPQVSGVVVETLNPTLFPAQAWAYVFPVSLLRIPYSLLVAVCWAIIVYYPVGLSPDPATCASGLLQQLMWQLRKVYSCQSTVVLESSACMPVAI